MLAVVLRIIGIAIGFSGAAMALMGNTRKSGKLTRIGRLSAVLILSGFATAIGIEIFEWKEKRTEQKWARDQKKLDEEWHSTESQTIAKLAISLHQRREVPVHQFEKELSEMQISFATLFQGRDVEPLCVRLRVLPISKEPDAEDRLKLVAEKGSLRCGSGSKTMLFKKGGSPPPQETVISVPRKEISIVLAQDRSEANGDETLTNHDGHIMVEVVGGGMTINNWPYSYDMDYDWTDPEEMACGIYAEIPWSMTGLDEVVRCLGDISRLAAISVSLPLAMSTDLVDSLTMELWLSDGQCFILDTCDMEFERNGGLRRAHFSGHGWKTGIRTFFYRHGGRAPTRTIVR